MSRRPLDDHISADVCLFVFSRLNSPHSTPFSVVSPLRFGLVWFGLVWFGLVSLSGREEKNGEAINTSKSSFSLSLSL